MHLRGVVQIFERKAIDLPQIVIVQVDLLEGEDARARAALGRFGEQT